MFKRLLDFVKRVFGMFDHSAVKKIQKEVQVTEEMAAAINKWFLVFYGKAPWAGAKIKQTRFAAILTNYIATLATNEIELNPGTSARAEYIKDQLDKFVVPDLQNHIQLAAAGGEVVLKPYVRDGNILCEVIAADRFYPTRIVGKTVEACFFTSLAKVNGHEVVRVERHDLQPQGIYIQNKAYYKESGAECPLADVPEWADIDPDVLIQNVKIPLYVALRMPFANTIDPTSPLPVSMYANAMDTLEEMDRIYSEFLWELHTGKRRQIFDISAIRPKAVNGMQTGLTYTDLATDQYILLDFGDDAKDPYKDYTPDMRVEAYQKAMDIQVRLLETQCGVSSGTFTFDIRTGQAKTATEILSQDKTTFNTTKSIQTRGMQQPLQDLILVYDMYATLYGLAPTGNVEPTVFFGDAIFEDTETEHKRRLAQVAAGLLRGELYMAWYYGVPEDEARKMIPNELDETDEPDETPQRPAKQSG